MLSNTHKTSLNVWKNQTYLPINHQLRHGYIPPVYKNMLTDDALNHHLETLDSAFNTQHLNKDLHVYRGFSSHHLPDLIKDNHYTDKGFVSTSLNPERVHGFSIPRLTLNNGRAYNFVHIHVPKGNKGLFIDHSQINLSGKHRGEQEVLLPRDSKFKYHGSENIGHAEVKLLKSDNREKHLILHHLTYTNS